ncbi:MAG: hypothetical protein MRY83_21650 [Flavobacteriales bacterium]|nr:hypothetical protein [Flavobacteriales bacterium]
MKNLITFLLLLSALFSFSQEEDLAENEMIAQLSIIYPVSTNGYMASKYTNRLSINVISGYANAVNGCEIGGVVNVLKDSMYGVQIAGFGNVVGGSSNGFQAAGFFNLVKKDVQGVQIAGFSNVATDSALALQISGFTNVCKGALYGGQVAGFNNLCASDLQGGQIAGFANTIHGNLKGLQMSGFSNVTTKDVEGYQVAGFFNSAKNVNGGQIGFVNVCDSMYNGVPIGFFSFVKKGYKRFAIGTNEVFYGTAQFKTGATAFHNIFSFGLRPTNNDFALGYGYGIGTGFDFGKRWTAEFNGVVHHILEDRIWESRLNLLSTINLQLEYSLSKHLGIFAGPSLNFHVNDRYDYDGDGPFLSSVAPSWSFLSETDNYTDYKMWFGLSLGLHLK